MDAPTLTGPAAGRKRLHASFGRFAYLYVVVIGIPVILFFVFFTPIYWWWIENVDGPQLEREFGFRLEHRDLALPSGASRPSLVVTAVAPGGRFDRAGVRQGDVITCLYHGKSDFWGQLLAARDGYQIEFKVLAPDRLEESCDGARRITLPGRSFQGSEGLPNNALKLTRSAMALASAALAA